MGYESAGKVKTAKFSLCSFTKPLQVCSEEMEQNPPLSCALSMIVLI